MNHYPIAPSDPQELNPDHPPAPSSPRSTLAPATPVIEISDVSVIIDGCPILEAVSWTVGRREHWVVLGPNGGGKSTLVAVAGLQRHPSHGTVRVLGHQLGQTDVRSLRSKIGTSSAGLVDQLRGSLTANEIVRCGLHAALEPWWHTYSDDDITRADNLLTSIGLAGYGARPFQTLSSGERQRTLLARTLMADPALVLLDEPTAGLDFGGRESMVAALDELAAAPNGPSTVLVTHHVEDIPPSTTHLMAINAGHILAQGPIGDVLSAPLLTQAYGLEVALYRRGNRWGATAITHH